MEALDNREKAPQSRLFTRCWPLNRTGNHPLTPYLVLFLFYIFGHEPWTQLHFGYS